MLPVFFGVMLEGRSFSRPVDVYRVFYEPIGFFSSWASAEKASRDKDLFFARYHLPLKGRTAVAVPIAPYNSLLSNKTVYLPVHIEAVGQRTITFFLDGAEKGFLLVNGERKGSFDLRGASAYVEIRISVAPGVYSLLFAVEKRRAALPFLLMADQPITLASRGFTKNFSATVSLSVRDFPDGPLHDKLWQMRCIPAPSGEERFVRVWRTVFEGGEVSAFDEKTTPLLVLLKHSTHEKARAMLLKAGFTDEMLEWWQERLSGKEICRNVQEP